MLSDWSERCFDWSDGDAAYDEPGRSLSLLHARWSKAAEDSQGAGETQGPGSQALVPEQGGKYPTWRANSHFVTELMIRRSSTHMVSEFKTAVAWVVFWL